MANKKSTSKKSTTTKKVETKTTKKVEPKKVEPKKVETKAAKKVTPKKVTVKKEVKPVVETKVEEKKVEPKKVETKKVVKKENNISNFFKSSRNILISILCLLLIANIILLVVGHRVQLENGKEVIASIEGKKYTAEDLFDTLKGKYGSDALVSLVDKFINEKELDADGKAEAKKKAQEYIESIKSQYTTAGYTWEDVLAQYGYANEEALVNEYMESVKAELVVKKYIKKDITDEEINKYYKEKVYGTYTVKHILITPDTTDTMTAEEKTAAEEAAKNTAQEVITKLQNGEDWATLVSTYSEDDGSKDNEGLVENFTYGDMDESFFNATVALEDNKFTTEPVKSQYGYHVIYRVSATEKPSLKDKKEDIINALVDEKLSTDSALYKNTLVKIRKDYKFEIKDTNLKSTYEKSISE